MHHAHHFLITFVPRIVLSSERLYLLIRGGHTNILWYSNVYQCIEWYQICYQGGNRNWYGRHKISFCYYGVCHYITWYHFFSLGGNINWPWGRKYLFGLVIFVSASCDIKYSAPFKFPPWCILSCIYVSFCYYFWSRTCGHYG